MLMVDRGCPELKRPETHPEIRIPAISTPFLRLNDHVQVQVQVKVQAVQVGSWTLDQAFFISVPDLGRPVFTAGPSLYIVQMPHQVLPELWPLIIPHLRRPLPPTHTALPTPRSALKQPDLVSALTVCKVSLQL